MSSESSESGQMAFNQLGIASVLKQFRLRVPPNQREYSWEKKHVSQLFRDLSKAISGSANREYFLGTIVTIPKPDQVLEVVDGQQRLATIALLLAQIRNSLQVREPLLAESITNGFLTDIDRQKRERVAKLQLNLVDNDYFRHAITSPDGVAKVPPAKQSHELIQEASNLAAEHIRNVLSSFDVRDHGDTLNRWISYLEHHAAVILLRVPSDGNAYKMFETLNDRGLRTSQWDLVKNYLFGESGDRLAEAQAKWSAMRGVLDLLEDDEAPILFLRHAMIAIRGHVTKDNVYDAVQGQAKGPQGAVTFLTKLEGLATYYVAMANPEHEKWNSYPDQIRKAIRTLNLFDIKPLRPLLLAIAARFPANDAAKAFTMLVSWGVRLIMTGSTRTGSVELPLAEAASLVLDPEAEGSISNITSLRKKLVARIPGDEEFRQAFELASISKPSLARYYLRSLEMTVKQEQDPYFIANDDREVINLEHVLPINPDGLWLGTGPGQFLPQVADVDAKRLGNMVLLLAKRNSDLSGSYFDAKKLVYARCPYELTNHVAREPVWDHHQIVERQKKLAAIATKTWPL